MNSNEASKMDHSSVAAHSDQFGQITEFKQKIDELTQKISQRNFTFAKEQNTFKDIE